MRVGSRNNTFYSEDENELIISLHRVLVYVRGLRNFYFVVQKNCHLNAVKP